jgi:hypothetical protein
MSFRPPFQAAFHPAFQSTVGGGADGIPAGAILFNGVPILFNGSAILYN